MVEWVNEYTAIPFLDGGRDRFGCDCWGLVRMVLRERFDIDVPSLAGEYESTADRERIPRLVDSTKPLVGAEKLGGPAAGLVVVLLQRGLPIHVGIMLDALHVLHIERGKGSVVERIDNARLRSRIEGFYRVN